MYPTISVVACVFHSKLFLTAHIVSAYYRNLIPLKYTLYMAKKSFSLTNVCLEQIVRV